MQTAYDQFLENMTHVANLDALYVYLTDVLLLPNDLTDILRAEWTYSVSALDKLIHELVRLGMLESFNGTRVSTTKFQNFSISTSTMNNIVLSSTSMVPPPEYWFEQEIIQKHGYLSFQEPDKINDALGLIWDHPQKWQFLAAATGIIPDTTLKTRLKTIIGRRNQIVHEADINPATGKRNDIDKTDTANVVTFIKLLAQEIFNAVK